MARALEPAGHGLLGGELATGDVFAGHAVAITRACDPLCRGTAILGGVAEIVLRRHVGSMGAGRQLQRLAPAHRRCGGLRGGATRAGLRPRRVHQCQHARLHLLCRQAHHRRERLSQDHPAFIALCKDPQRRQAGLGKVDTEAGGHHGLDARAAARAGKTHHLDFVHAVAHGAHGVLQRRSTGQLRGDGIQGVAPDQWRR